MTSQALKNTINTILHNDPAKLQTVLGHIVEMMVENVDVDAIALVLEYIPHDDAMATLAKD